MTLRRRVRWRAGSTASGPSTRPRSGASGQRQAARAPGAAAPRRCLRSGAPGRRSGKAHLGRRKAQERSTRRPASALGEQGPTRRRSPRRTVARALVARWSSALRRSCARHRSPSAGGVTSAGTRSAAGAPNHSPCTRSAFASSATSASSSVCTFHQDQRAVVVKQGHHLRDDPARLRHQGCAPHQAAVELDDFRSQPPHAVEGWTPRRRSRRAIRLPSLRCAIQPAPRSRSPRDGVLDHLEHELMPCRPAAFESSRRWKPSARSVAISTKTCG